MDLRWIWGGSEVHSGLNGGGLEVDWRRIRGTGKFVPSYVEPFFPLNSTWVDRFSMHSMDFRGFPWISMDFRGFPWISVDFRGPGWLWVDVGGLWWIWDGFGMDFRLCE